MFIGLYQMEKRSRVRFIIFIFSNVGRFSNVGGFENVGLEALEAAASKRLRRN